MLIQLSRLELQNSLTTRKEKFNKCRIVNGVITLADLIENKKEEIVEKETIELKPIAETAEEIKAKKQEPIKESKVVKLDTAPNTSEAARTYTQQFKGGYFGKRKRF